MDIVREGKLVDFLSEVRTVPVKDEKNRFAGRVFCCCLGYEALLEPFCAEKLISPAIG